jgi:hypothetical protein
MNAKKTDKVRDLSTKKIDEEKAQQVKGGATTTVPKKPGK